MNEYTLRDTQTRFCLWPRSLEIINNSKTTQTNLTYRIGIKKTQRSFPTATTVNTCV